MNSFTGQRRKRGRSIKEVMRGKSNGLGALMHKARLINFIDLQLDRLLQPDMAKMVRSAGLNEGTLILVTPSAAIATRLRLEQSSLLASLSAAMKKRIDSLVVTIAPLPMHPRPARKKRDIPESTRKALQGLGSNKK